MQFSIQPILENETVGLYPLQEVDFDALYAVASDPKIWEQHPTNDRWKKEVFKAFFDEAVQSGGAFKIVDKTTGAIAGSTRFYGYDEQENCICIGYTFYATQYWGTGANRAVKKMMLDYVFQFVSKVYFHIGAFNIRSQIAISRLGAEKVGEQMIAYPGRSSQPNFLYVIDKKSVILTS